jgi:hypothetical protein
MSFGGQSVAAADKRGLFLKVFSGEVMKAYERAIKISPLVTQRTITSGKSAQFPTTGVAAARYFTPGDDLFVSSSATDAHAYLSKIKQSERVIHIDELLTSACFIDDLDEAMSHYDYRSIFAAELGKALGRHQDNMALYQIFMAAKNVGNVASETTPGQPTGHQLDNSTFYSDGASALDSLYDAAAILDKADVPKEDRFVILNPDGYYALLKEGVFTVPDTGAATDARMLFDGQGNDYVGGRITMVAGMPVVVTNANGITTAASNGSSANDGIFLTDTKGGDANTTAGREDAGSRNISPGLADGADTDGTGTLGTTGNNGDATANCMALVFHKSAVGCVKLRDITMESEYIIERQGTLMVAKLATGMAPLRNDAAVSIVAAP